MKGSLLLYNLKLNCVFLAHWLYLYGRILGDFTFWLRLSLCPNFDL